MEELIDIGLNLMHSSFKKDRLEILKEASKVGVNQFIITGTNINSSEIACEFASKYPKTLFSTSGVHPHDAKTCDETTLKTLESIAQEDCVVAVGECGLDYNRNFSHPKTQREWFEKQVELAECLNMPLFLHEREAHEDLYNILKKHDSVAEKCVIHCFTGNKAEAQNYIDLGAYIGITGWICDMKRGLDLQDAVKIIPEDKLMIETDAPFLIPKNFDKKPKKNRNEPKYLPHILKTIAYFKNYENVDELARQITNNTKKFFKI
ncbi:Tat-linked quality control protein TatD [Methanobrevibacter oralis]|uniref:Tat-linked quality control protein TatD n=1 Tax=Methanobrevibacter oralis TaxID=66851 RepID=A0A166ATM8_METOA|nr:TatD family hydrolase [Methanobrevibacter oralis]KZX12459.1 Tat-linked quality control protein TatD [Methanobrevibacter oralis]